MDGRFARLNMLMAQQSGGHGMHLGGGLWVGELDPAVQLVTCCSNGTEMALKRYQYSTAIAPRWCHSGTAVAPKRFGNGTG